MALVCLLTPGQPSTNPRLVKEADALVETGHTVHVVCAHWAQWADETDRALLRSRKLTSTYVGGIPWQGCRTYEWTRFRHRVGTELCRFLATKAVRHWALCRVTPELQHAAERVNADLYIAHNLGAVPAAWIAARRRGAKFGFDAEDFHSGSGRRHPAEWTNRLVERTEAQILPECDYMTAAAPLIADRYAAKYRIPTPTTVLNVFPLAERPAAFRERNRGEPVKLYWFSQTIGANRGLEDVIRAMGLLREYPLILHLQGGWQPGYEGVLRRLAAAERVTPEQIVHLPPSRPDGLVRQASKFDIGLALEPGRDENNDIVLSNKIFTYLLGGSAVCATSTSGQRRLVQELEGAAFCYPPGDIKALTAGLRHWCGDHVALTAARRRAWAYATSRFNWDREKPKFLNVVEAVLGRPSSRVA